MSQYREAVMALRPLAYWRFGEPSGYIALDELWNHHGTYNAGPTLRADSLITGDPDTAVQFSGVAQWVEVPDHADFNIFEGTSSWSVVQWVKHTHDATERMLFDKIGAGVSGVNVRSGNFLLAYRGDAGVADQIFLDPLDTDLQFVVTTYDGSNLTVYVNLVIPPGLFGTSNPTPSTRSLPALTSGLGLAGVPGSGGQGFNGVMDDTAVFDYALSLGQITALWTAGNTPATGLDEIALAIADRFLAVAMTPPAGYNPIRSSLANLPNELPPLPCVLVFPDSGDFDTGNGTRLGTHDFFVRFYFAQTIDLTRDMNALRKWVSVLWYQLRDSVQLAGIVDRATVDGYQMGMLTYGGETYSGIELRVHVVKTEPWAAVA